MVASTNFLLTSLYANTTSIHDRGAALAHSFSTGKQVGRQFRQAAQHCAKMSVLLLLFLQLAAFSQAQSE